MCSSPSDSLEILHLVHCGLLTSTAFVGPMQRQYSIFLVLIALVLPTIILSAHAHEVDSITIQISPSREECFYEDVMGGGVKMFFHYMVTGGGSLDVNAKVIGPDGVIWVSERETENRVLFKSRVPGMHRFCFSNTMSTVTSKVVTFSVVLDETDLEDWKKFGTGGKPDMNDALDGERKEQDSMLRSIRRLVHGLSEVDEVQKVARRSLEDSFQASRRVGSRLVFLSVVEIIIIIGTGCANVIYLRKLLGKKKRMV